MRIKLAIISGAILVLTTGTGAAYAVVGHTTVSPTVTGNVLPLDDNHSSRAGLEPGDDRGGQSSTGASRTTEPGDDRGAATTEPGDDRGSVTTEPGDDRGATAEPGDDRGRGTDDATAAPSRNGGTVGSGAGSTGSTSGRGSDDSAAGSTTVAGATTASGADTDDHGRGRDGAGHH
jgi:hypothetical protein